MVLRNRALLALYHDDFESLERSATAGQRCFVELGDGWGEAETLQLLSWSNSNQGRYAAGLAQAEAALALRRELGDTRGLANAFMSVGMINARLGALDCARDALTESLELWRTVGDVRGLSGAFSELGLVAMLSGDAERGTVYHGEALQIIRGLGMEMWLAMDLCSEVVDIYLHAGRFTTAAAMLAEGLPIAEAQNVVWFQGAARLRFAALALLDGRTAAVQAELAKAIPDLASIKRLDDLGLAYLLDATAAALDGDTLRGSERLEQGECIAAQTGHYGLRCISLLVQSLLAGRMDHGAEADRLHQAAIAHPFVANSHYFVRIYGRLASRNNG